MTCANGPDRQDHQCRRRKLQPQRPPGYGQHAAAPGLGPRYNFIDVEPCLLAAFLGRSDRTVADHIGGATAVLSSIHRAARRVQLGFISLRDSAGRLGIGHDRGERLIHSCAIEDATRRKRGHRVACDQVGLRLCRRLRLSCANRGRLCRSATPQVAEGKKRPMTPELKTGLTDGGKVTGETFAFTT